MKPKDIVFKKSSFQIFTLSVAINKFELTILDFLNSKYVFRRRYHDH